MIRQQIKRKADVIEQLIEQAYFDLCLSADPVPRQIQRWRESGAPTLPLKLKPGALIERLDPKHRELLASATSSDFYPRVDSIFSLSK